MLENLSAVNSFLKCQKVRFCFLEVVKSIEENVAVTVRAVQRRLEDEVGRGAVLLGDGLDRYECKFQNALDAKVEIVRAAVPALRVFALAESGVPREAVVLGPGAGELVVAGIAAVDLLGAYAAEGA